MMATASVKNAELVVSECPALLEVVEDPDAAWPEVVDDGDEPVAPDEPEGLLDWVLLVVVVDDDPGTLLIWTHWGLDADVSR